jgi:hypothetical protein
MYMASAYITRCIFSHKDYFFLFDVEHWKIWYIENHSISIVNFKSYKNLLWNRNRLKLIDVFRWNR